MSKYKHYLLALAAILCLAGVVGGATTVAADSAGSGCAILPQVACDGSGGNNSDPKNNGVMTLLKWVLRLLTGGVGIVAVGAIVFAGILYTSAGDDAGQVSKAKGIITNTIIGLVAYGLMALVLNFLIPGGVFG